MRFKLFRQHGALNSPQIFDAFEQGIKNIGHTSVNDNQDVSVIWSVLWNGRMRANEKIYNEAISQNKPVIIIEVGNLIRNRTWRICLNHINGLGIFGNDSELDPSRPQQLGIRLLPEKTKRNPQILIATQHEKSLQWKGMPPMKDWTAGIIKELRKFTDRPIVIRPHPRSPMMLSQNMENVVIQKPTQIKNSYDDFDINYDYHCVINHNSGVPILAAIAGTPVITGPSSLAHPVSDTIENIENPSLPMRDDWLVAISHCEWTVDEIAEGIPMKRLEASIMAQLNS